MRIEPALCLTALLALSCEGLQPATVLSPSPFRIKRVTLYDSGLAWVEREAEVSGASKLEIRLALAHLDDLLATLVLATDDQVKVRAVRFPAVRNLGQALASASMGNALIADDRESLQMPASLEEVAKSLVGTPVTVSRREGAKVEGTVLACVETDRVPEAHPGHKNNGAEGKSPEEPRSMVKSLVLVSPQGGLFWVPLNTIVQIAPSADREARAIQAFASQLGKANGFKEVSLSVETTKDSQGRLAAGYLRQAPLWRMAYRVNALADHLWMEAWAVVHNDTTEDWQDVDLTLLSGLPQSYVLSLATPRYGSREIQHPSQGEIYPQLGARTPDSLMYSLGDGTIGLGSIGLTGHGAGGGGTGYGRGTGRITGRTETSSSLLQVGESAAEPGAQGEVRGEIATYTALNKVTVPRGSSTLVPLIRSPMEGRAFTLVGRGDKDNPPTCVRAENGTGLVLQAGMASFTIDGRFRGQAEVARTEPGEVRVWCYGQDPDIRVSQETKTEESSRLAEWREETLWVHSLRKSTTEYTIENLAGQPRLVAIEVRHLDNGKVLSPQDLLAGEGTSKLYFLDIPGRDKRRQVVEVEEGVMRTLPLTTQAMDRLLQSHGLPSLQSQALTAAREGLLRAEELDGQGQRMKDQIAKLTKATDRTRENLKAVPQMAASSAAVERMLADLMATEETLRRLQDEQEDLGAQAETQRQGVRGGLQTLGKAQD